MRKYLPHILIISFVFILAPTAQVVSYAGAIEDAKEEVRKNPDDADAYFNLAKLIMDKSGKHEDAIESFKQAIEIDPDDASAHKNLGVAHTRKEDKGESTGSIWVTNQEQQYGPRTQSGAGCDGM